jgi:hypothetical protein
MSSGLPLRADVAHFAFGPTTEVATTLQPTHSQRPTEARARQRSSPMARLREDVGTIHRDIAEVAQHTMALSRGKGAR